jgi:hypothetical protein
VKKEERMRKKKKHENIIAEKENQMTHPCLKTGLRLTFTRLSV